MKKTVLFAFVLTVAAWGNSTTDWIHSIKKVETPEAIKEKIRNLDFEYYTNSNPSLPIDISEIINIGEQIWSIIEKNKPVLKVSYVHANALPKGLSAEDMEGFSDIQFASYNLSGKNLYGMRVYNVTYTIAHRYGGNVNGKGHFIENATVLPHKVDVAWGYNVDLGVTKTSTSNAGTKEDPVGQLLLELTFKVSTVVKAHEYRNLFDFRGDSATVKAIED